MEGSFLSPPVKRSSNYRSAANGSRKRSKLKPPPLPVPRGHVAFRLLCRTSLVGGFIGKSGSVIQQLQKDTGAKIRVQEAPRASDDRIILVIASSALKNTITLGTRRGREEPAPAAAADGDDAVEDKDTLQVSPAQEALLRVFDRVNEVAEETDGVSKNNGVTVSCRLLAESSQVGSVIGKGGKVIEKIRKASGCKIRVSKGDKLPGCAEANDELVEIEGNLLDVKKALVAISQRLQDYPPVDNYDSHVEQYSTKSALLVSKQSSSVAYTSGLHPLALKADRISILDSETPQQDVVFRLLCSTDTAGGVIGKGGSIVRALQDETGATISIGPAVAECDERLITITASENMESRISPAQNAICLVFARSVEAAIEKGLDSSLNKGSLVSARLVAPSTQVGCLLGKGGAIISEMRRESGAGIRVLGRDQVPKCASGNDQVVQISGEFVNVQDALCHVTARLRDSLFSTTSNGPDFRNNTSVITELSPHLRARDAASLGVHASSAIPHSFNQHTHLTRGLDGLDPHDVDYYSPPKYFPKMVAGVNSRATTEVGRGLTFKGGLELGSGSKSAIVTNTTVEIVVPENVIGSVYGENGSNLTRLRQVSGAKVIVHEPHPGTTDRLVVISGTPDETQAAQSLLQAFILTGPL